MLKFYIKCWKIPSIKNILKKPTTLKKKEEFQKIHRIYLIYTLFQKFTILDL